MHLTIEPKTTVAVGAFGAQAATLSVSLEGRKTWMAHNQLRFETSAHNLGVFRSIWPTAVVKDTRQSMEDAILLDERPSQPVTTPVPAFVMTPMDFQLENFHRFKDKLQWAIFSEQGTGKTKVAIDIICHRYLKGMVTGVIILSSPKGVHAQWIQDQLPKHIWHSLKPHVLTYVWDGKKAPEWIGKATDELQIISGNIDMVKSSGAELLKKHALQHRERLLILVDESDSIKNLRSQRSKHLRALAALTPQRAIMTGTPIAKDLTDEWAQFYFLDPNIIGHKYLTSFRSQYCMMGGFENKVVVGHRNMDQFKRLTSPHIFRATKKDLSLPEKVYDEVVFDLAPWQKRMMKEIKQQFFSSLHADGPTVSVTNGAVALMRMQQLANGFIVDENEFITRMNENPRLDALLDLRRQISGKCIIWCRFKEDVRLVSQMMGKGVVTYFGETDQQGRAEAKEAFLKIDSVTDMVATAGAAGKGVDGLQKVCSTAIYYSNSFNAIDRWQSEDRIHRIGMGGTATYFDLIGRGSPDRGILANLRRKKNISALAIDDLRQIMEDI